MARLEIYTDGACAGNPGSGGHGVVALYDDKYIVKEYSHYSKDTTNNREELKAMLYALTECAKNLKRIKLVGGAIIYSDSAYVVNMCNDWIWDWANDDWKNSKKETIKNIDIVQEIYQKLNELRKYSNFIPIVTIEKVAGHAGVIGNELADALAAGNEKKRNKICRENEIISIDVLLKKNKTEE